MNNFGTGVPGGAAGSLASGSHIIKGRWKILRRIGAGAFGEIYQGRDINSNQTVAIKVERVDSKKQVLKLEVNVLKKLQASDWVVGFIACGRHHDFHYMVMDLLGDNLSDLRRKQPGAKFSMMTTCRLGIQMIKALEACHDLGYLHRDIKPSNYAIGVEGDKKNVPTLIDFGLARKYVLGNGEVRPARENTGFRGTARYASIRSHQSEDLGRRDDMWSIFYLLVEFATGSLPWRRVKDKDQVGDLKIKYHHDVLVADLPREFGLFWRHLETLEFADRPDYDLLCSLLEQVYTKVGGTAKTPLDWEKAAVPQTIRPRLLPTLTSYAFAKVVADIDRYDVSALPQPLKRKLLDFLIRIFNGRLPPSVLNNVLDKEVKELDLISCDFGEKDFKSLASTCSNLRSLSLGATTDMIVKEITASNSKLEELSVYCSARFTNKAIKMIVDTCPNLTVLKLKCSEKINDKSIELILRACSNLHELSLFGCKKIKGTAFSMYTKKKTRPFTIRRLNLSYCELSKKGFKSMAKISYVVEALHFSPLSPSFKITSADFTGLIQNCANLKVLDLSNYHFEMDAILLEVSKSCPKLDTLLLDGVGMTDFGLQHVAQCCSELRTLRFRYGDGVTDTSLHAIAQYCSGLRSLTLDFWNKFNQLSASDNAIRKLLCSCTQLAELSLCNCQVLTDACFPETAYFPALKTLNLSECVQLKDTAIKRITSSCPSLTRLDLNNLNSLSEASLDYISRGCPLLEDLYLISCSCFSDESLRRLVKRNPVMFVQVTRYTDFDLRGSLKEIHQTTVDDIFARYPNTFRERAHEKTRKRLFGMDGFK